MKSMLSMPCSMNIFKKMPILRTAFSRIMETTSFIMKTESPTTPAVPTATNLYIIEPLSEREIVRVRGEEVIPFLQGLITNDMYQLQAQNTGSNALSSMYALFLNKAGRVLYDSIIYRTSDPNTYLIECDRYVSHELRRHLRLYRVRRKIEVESGEQYRPWILFKADGVGNVDINTSLLPSNVLYTVDPRLRELGIRILTSLDKSWGDLAKYLKKTTNAEFKPASEEFNYRFHRYRYGVGEGVIDLPPGKCFPLEANCDFLHGVSFQKGCYIGQELTARVHHTGVIRKRLMPLYLSGPISSKASTVLSETGLNVGVVRNIKKDYALALMRVEQALSASQLQIDGVACGLEKPKWWPNELQKKRNIRDVGY